MKSWSCCCLYWCLDNSHTTTTDATAAAATTTTIAITIAATAVVDVQMLQKQSFEGIFLQPIGELSCDLDEGSKNSMSSIFNQIILNILFYLLYK